MEEQAAVERAHSPAVESEDDSDYSVLGDAEERLEIENGPPVTYQDRSLDVSETVLSDHNEVLSGSSAGPAPSSFTVPPYLSLSQFVADRPTEQAMEKLLEEYKVNQTVLDQVLKTVMEIKAQKKDEDNDVIQKLVTESDEMRKNIQIKDERIAELQKLITEHVQGSSSTLLCLKQQLDSKFNSLAENISSLSLSQKDKASLDMISLDSSMYETTETRKVIESNDTTTDNPYQQAEEQLAQLQNEQPAKDSDLISLSTVDPQEQDLNSSVDTAVPFSEADTLVRVTELEELTANLRTALDLKAEEIANLKRELRERQEELDTHKVIVAMIRDDSAVLDEVVPIVSDYEQQIKTLEVELQRMHERNESRHHKRRCRRQNYAPFVAPDSAHPSGQPSPRARLLARLQERALSRQRSYQRLLDDAAEAGEASARAEPPQQPSLVQPSAPVIEEVRAVVVDDEVIPPAESDVSFDEDTQPVVDLASDDEDTPEASPTDGQQQQQRPPRPHPHRQHHHEHFRQHFQHHAHFHQRHPREHAHEPHESRGPFAESPLHGLLNQINRRIHATVQAAVSHSFDHINAHLAAHVPPPPAPRPRPPPPPMFVCECLQAFPTEGQLVAHRSSCILNVD